MEKNYLQEAEKYYTFIGEKKVHEFSKFLHADVELYSPMAVVKGKEAVVLATSNFMKSFRSLKIRAKFASGDKAMIVYNTDIPGIAEDFPGASMLTFRDGLIVKIELFYDSSRFLAKKEEIFS